MHDTGFFSLINTGFSEEEVQRQYDIGQGFFELPFEEKGKPEYRCDFTKGNYFGYRQVSKSFKSCARLIANTNTKSPSAQAHEKTIMSTDVLDNVESINIAKFIPEYKNEAFHPFFNPYKDEIEVFSRVCFPSRFCGSPSIL